MDVVKGLGKAAIITLVNAVEGCGGNGREKKKIRSAWQENWRVKYAKNAQSEK